MLRTLLLVLVTGVLLYQEQHLAAAPSLRLRYGVAAFGDVNPLQSIDVLASAGYDYVEPGLSLTLALAPDALAAARAKVRTSGVPLKP